MQQTKQIVDTTSACTSMHTSSYQQYSDFTIKWATLPWELEQAHLLRRKVFCDEQQLFEDDDFDAVDDYARVLVALGNFGGWHQDVVGTVRIHQEAQGVWFGSRLAVDPAFRTQGNLGPMLIKLAVSSAHALGCHHFFAKVQEKNVPLFVRNKWTRKESCVVAGSPHALMEADLSVYPPCHSPSTGFVIKARKKRKTLDARSAWLECVSSESLLEGLPDNRLMEGPSNTSVAVDSAETGNALIKEVA